MSDRFAPHVEELVSGVRFGKFVSVGAIGAVFDITTLTLLLRFTEFGFAIANVASIEVAILVMFVVNENWTFAEAGAGDGRSVGERLLRSHLVRASGSTIQYVLALAVITLFPFEFLFAGVNLWFIAVKGGSIAIAMVVNYVFESLFTWRVHDDTDDRGKN